MSNYVVPLEDWVDDQDEIKNNFNLNFNNPYMYDICFPTTFEDENKNKYGEITALVIKNLSKNVEISKKASFNIEIKEITEKFKLKEEVCFQVKELLKKKFNGINYININQKYETYSNLNCEDNINESSHNLAFAVSLIINSSEKIKKELKNKICLTGNIKENAQVDAISENGIIPKLCAVLFYNIDKFYIPNDNFESIKKYVLENINKNIKTNQDQIYVNKLKKNEYLKDITLELIKNGQKFIINKPTSTLEIIPVNNVEDVLIDLFGKDWFDLDAFKEGFDLSYMYKQKLLKSEFVKIKNIIEISKSNEKYDDKKIISSSGTIDKFVPIYMENENRDKNEKNINYLELTERINLNNKIIIRASVGSGKSTILRAVLNEILTNDKYKNIIPIFIELQILKEFKHSKEQITKETIIEQALTQLFEKDQIELFKKNLLKQNNLVFLLDAYDELGNEESFNDLGNYILTTRPTSSVDTINKLVYKLLPLDINSILALFKEYINDDIKIKEFDKIIINNDKLQILLNNPLILTLVIFNIINKKDYLNSLDKTDRFDIITASIETLINKKLKEPKKNKILNDNINRVKFKKDPNLSTKDNFTTKIISKIAFKSFDMNEIINSDMIKDVIDKEIEITNNKKSTKAKKISSYSSIEELFNSYILNNTGFLEFYRVLKEGKIEERNKFFHELFQEYFTSKHVDYDYVTYLDNVKYKRESFVSWVNSRKPNVRYMFNILPFLSRMIELNKN